MYKTDKSVLLKCLENQVIDVDHELPFHIDLTVIDGFFFLYLLRDVPLTFGNISKQILQAVTKEQSRNIAIVKNMIITLLEKNKAVLQIFPRN